MQPELTLMAKCPACGTRKPKTLAALKAQAVFECDCGFHAPIVNGAGTTDARTARPRKAAVTS